jgi:hypothetical protein
MYSVKPPTIKFVSEATVVKNPNYKSINSSSLFFLKDIKKEDTRNKQSDRWLPTTWGFKSSLQ